MYIQRTSSSSIFRRWGSCCTCCLRAAVCLIHYMAGGRDIYGLCSRLCSEVVSNGMSCKRKETRNDWYRGSCSPWGSVLLNAYRLGRWLIGSANSYCCDYRLTNRFTPWIEKKYIYIFFVYITGVSTCANYLMIKSCNKNSLYAVGPQCMTIPDLRPIFWIINYSFIHTVGPQLTTTSNLRSISRISISS